MPRVDRLHIESIGLQLGRHGDQILVSVMDQFFEDPDGGGDILLYVKSDVHESVAFWNSELPVSPAI